MQADPDEEGDMERPGDQARGRAGRDETPPPGAAPADGGQRDEEADGDVQEAEGHPS